MKRVLSALLAMFSAAALCACGAGSDAPRAVRTESVEEPFSITEAEALIRPWDAAAAWMGAQDTVTRAEAEAVELYVDASFPGEGENLVFLFLDVAQWESEETQKFAVVPTQFCPTMFHEDVAVTGVVKTTDTVEYEGGMVTERVWLEVTEAYTGADESLAGWERSYVFEQADGEWVFFSFDGTVNFGGENWRQDHLPLKKSADEIYTPYV